MKRRLTTRDGIRKQPVCRRVRLPVTLPPRTAREACQMVPAYVDDSRWNREDDGRGRRWKKVVKLVDTITEG